MAKVKVKINNQWVEAYLNGNTPVLRINNTQPNQTTGNIDLKSINNESLLGTGNIDITSAEWGNITGTLSDQTDLQNALDAKQDTLVSGTNIKTINNTSILGSGDIQIEDTPEVQVSTTTPTEGKIWVNPDEVTEVSLNPITNQYSVATDKGYSCDYANKNLNKKGESTLVFSGSSAPNVPCQINTTWESIGKFNYLTVELYKSSTNSYSPVIFPYFMFSTGNNINESKRNVNVWQIGYIDGSTISVHIIPSNQISSDSITFDSYSSGITISKISITY